MDISSKKLSHDIQSGVSPKKFESLNKRLFNMVLAKYLEENKKVLIEYYYYEKNMKQCDISKKIGVSQSTVSRLLHKATKAKR